MIKLLAISSALILLLASTLQAQDHRNSKRPYRYESTLESGYLDTIRTDRRRQLRDGGEMVLDVDLTRDRIRVWDVGPGYQMLLLDDGADEKE